MKQPGIASHIRKHLRPARAARESVDGSTPPFLTLFINSLCNLMLRPPILLTRPEPV